MAIEFKTIDGTFNTTSGNWEVISEQVSIDLLEYANKRSTMALLTLCVPAPYATGNDYPDLSFAIMMGFKVLVHGTISYDQKSLDSPGRRPITLQAAVDLKKIGELAPAVVVWRVDRGSSGHIDSSFSLSAVINEPESGY